MLPELLEHQYELRDLADDAPPGLIFGTEDTGYLTTTRPRHASATVRTSDTSRSYEDGIGFGRDLLDSKSVDFEIAVLTDVGNLGLEDRPTSAPQALRRNLDYLDRIEGVWHDERWRRNAQALAVLRTREGGRVSRAYGRPRRYEEVVGNLTTQGWTPITCGFVLKDARWYDDLEKSTSTTLRRISEGGVVAPVVAPVTTTAEARNVATAEVGGTQSTWLTVEFTGPVVEPSVQVGDLIIGLNGALAYDETVVIDPSPWARTVLRSTDGASLAGRLSGRTPSMDQMLLAPGTHAVTFRGRDDSATARVALRWRDARKRP